ncbi:MAG: hypothetical protein ABJM98_07500, partial [Ekhidna sp.]
KVVETRQIPTTAAGSTNYGIYFQTLMYVPAQDTLMFFLFFLYIGLMIRISRLSIVGYIVL